MNSAIPLGMKICSAIIFVIPFGLLSEKFANGSEQETYGSVLDMKINYLKLEKATMEEALIMLRGKDPDRIILGFEKIPEKKLELTSTMSFEMRDTNVADILNRLCLADPRYTYELVSEVLINVFPVRTKMDADNLLNMSIKDFTIRGKYQPSNIIEDIDRLAPELREFLARKEQEYVEKTGKAYGTVGSILSSDYAPDINIDLHNMTIRKILNFVTIYNINRSKEENLGPPFSWKYEFELDEDAPTGLGGFPKWNIF